MIMQTAMLLFSLLSTGDRPTQAKQYALTISVKGITKEKGDIHIGIYNKEEGFSEVDKTFRNAVLPATGKVLQYRFEDLPQGQYAVCIFQDYNKNGKLDKNLVGAPTEPYGFSNNPRIFFRAPTFQETRIALRANLDLEVWLK